METQKFVVEKTAFKFKIKINTKMLCFVSPCISSSAFTADVSVIPENV